MSKIPTSGKGKAEARILACAAGMFANFGYNGASVHDIAVGAGVNEITIYRHYSRKRDLYAAVLDSELQQVKLSGDLLARIAEAEDARTAVARTFELITATLLGRQDLLRLMQFCSLEMGDDIDPLVRKHLGELVEVIARYLEPWVSKGELRAPSAKAIVLSLISIILSHRSSGPAFRGRRYKPRGAFQGVCGTFGAGIGILFFSNNSCASCT